MKAASPSIRDLGACLCVHDTGFLFQMPDSISLTLSQDLVERSLIRLSSKRAVTLVLHTAEKKMLFSQFTLFSPVSHCFTERPLCAGDGDTYAHTSSFLQRKQSIVIESHCKKFITLAIFTFMVKYLLNIFTLL